MINSATSVFLIILAGLATACASGPTKPDKLDNQRVVNLPMEQAWTKAMQALASSGYAVQSAVKEAGSISTAKKTVRLTSDEADCGTYMGIGYIKDDRTVLGVTYSLFLKSAGAGTTDVTVNTNIDGTYQAGNNTKMLDCFSKGALEKAILDKISP